MKKTFSFLMSVVILIVSLPCLFSTLAGATNNYQRNKVTSELQNFAEDVYALTSKYDSVLNDSHNSSETIEAVSLISTASVDTDIDYESFETKRLIVYSDESFDTCNAVEHLSGYENMHLLQYDSAESAITAYEYYCDNDVIDSVEPDVIVTLESYEKEAVMSDYIDYPHDATIEPSWGYERIGTYDTFQYILQHKSFEELPQIVIGVIDSGIQTGNKYFDERIIGAYSFIGKDPYSDTNGHGSKVAGVIWENTLPNVKIISYQVFESNHTSTYSLTLLAEEQAQLDGVHIINSSYGHNDINDATSNSNNTSIKNDTPLQIAAAGNHGSSVLHYPAANPNAISVAALDEYNSLATFSAKGQWVDVAAPGSRLFIPSTSTEGKSIAFSGTSCATPLVASVCAMIMTHYPTFSNSLVADTLFKSCEKINLNIHYGIVNMFNAVTYHDSDARQTSTPQFSLESHPAENQFYSETQYVELTCSDKNARIYYTLDKTIPSQSNGILYTEPIELSASTSVYAVAYSDEYFKSEVAKRNFLIRIPLSDYTNENGWHIRENGMIWGYSGPNMDLVIPEVVLGIKVKGIENEAFSEQAYINSVTMPESLTVIEDKAFYKCNSLTSITAPGVIEIGDSAFYRCSNLDNVSFPKLQSVGKTSFKNSGSLSGFPFENLIKVPKNAFCDSDIYKVNLANATTIQDLAFSRCSSLTEVSIPKVDTETNMGIAVFQNCVMLESVKFNENTSHIPESTFDGCSFSSLDCFDTIESVDSKAFSNNTSLTNITMKSLIYISESTFENCSNLISANFPNAVDIEHEAFQGCSSLAELTLSDNVTSVGSTAFNGCKNLKYISINGDLRLFGEVFAGSSIERLEMSGVGLADSLPVIENSIIALPSTFYKCTEDTTGRNYKIYGTSGTYAEKWAKENGHTFINISQSTAILKDVPMEYTGNGEVLSVDVIGFNRIYQWYSNTENNNTTGTPIEGATSKDFNPEDYPAAKHYYCVVTSTDKGYAPIQIFTGVTENKTIHIHAVEELHAVSPTCTESGLTSGAKCSVCDETIIVQQEIPALGHHYTSVVNLPTCIESGYTIHTCSICNDSYKNDYTNAIGHKYENGICTICNKVDSTYKPQINPALSLASYLCLFLKYLFVFIKWIYKLICSLF